MDGDLVVDGSISVTHGQFSGNIIAEEIRINGSLNQDFNDFGAIKGLIYYTPASPTTCGRSWVTEGSVSCNQIGPGLVNITFSSSVTGRYWQVTTAETSPRIHGTRIDPANSRRIQVRSYDDWNPFNYADTSFILTLY